MHIGNFESHNHVYINQGGDGGRPNHTLQKLKKAAWDTMFCPDRSSSSRSTACVSIVNAVWSCFPSAYRDGDAGRGVGGEGWRGCELVIGTTKRSRGRAKIMAAEKHLHANRYRSTDAQAETDPQNGDQTQLTRTQANKNARKAGTSRQARHGRQTEHQWIFFFVLVATNLLKSTPCDCRLAVEVNVPKLLW